MKAALFTRTARRARQDGFTLVELMVGMALGLFILLALVTLLINVNRNNSEMSRSNNVIENGRFALQLLSTDVAHGGFLGGYVPNFDDLTYSGAPQLVPATTITDAAQQVPSSVPDPCVAYASWDEVYKRNLVGIPVQVHDVSSPSSSWTPPVCSGRLSSPKPKANTDVLFIRHLENQACTPGATGCLASGEVYFQAPRCTTTAAAGYTTQQSALGANNAFLLATSASNDNTTFNLRQRNCTSANEVRKFVSNMYYVRDYAVTSGDGIPTLMRSQFSGGTHAAAEAIVEGIEGFRAELGIDNVSDFGTTLGSQSVSGSTVAGPTGGSSHLDAIAWANSTVLTSPTNRGDGLPDGSYVQCSSGSPCTPYQLMNAVAVKLHVLARSDSKTPGHTDAKVYCLGSNCPAPTYTTCPSGGANPQPLLGPFCDGYKRHLFTRTVRLTNVSMRRETP
ncbi:PilW family protein [Ramlibacter sp.]|uniref:PilW family protein n=1 Tax=Ramlibacter sp. TaxID=1917967 RepID=UPI001813B987|nr:PilW family protein [Ramlibacter sp.]MBA2674042.1 PilW family protein [Ramlibacter sp.]